MKNKKSKNLILIGVFIVLVLSFSFVIAAQNKDISLLSIFKSNSYKIKLGDETKKLEKKDNVIYLGVNDLKTMLMKHYGSSDIYVDLIDNKPDENGIISLIVDEESSNPVYSLGQVFFINNNGWSVNKIQLSIDDTKYLHLIDNNSYVNALVGLSPDIHSRLINRDHTIPENFNDGNIVALKGVQAILSSKGMKLDKVTLENLKVMLDKAAEDGIKGFVLNSTYRSYQEQKSLFDYRYNERKNSGVADPYEEASKVVAYPGTSEHQTGMALDILSTKYPKGSTFHNSEEYAWLMENCWDYGFIPRYPEEKVEKTRISFEPWHYRYIGKPLSLYAKAKGYCLEEVVESLQNNRLTNFKASNEEEYVFLLLKKDQNFMVESGLNVDFSYLELTAEDNLLVVKLGA
ncbi:M15 family metallopeptidase [Lutispora thermophila]|uniref:LD-carboxypeptidase LdcB, LAS superfamily n=1 Tax=Lutispora thermophila DSM 19022 TaxID=1122184 RepID=A0A1M6E316_9FIRM|nr:M15 family metallopeptidase [Lutispora thermophila]SHI79648.1 LD-carboxypeptidase LdcB, LAS superfamily [Lutispora thermophila DSM 19022]